MKVSMLDWMMGRGLTAGRPRKAVAEPPRPGRAMSGEYLLLYNYLENRYAHTVVLTFAQIEDLLGFVLPEQARLHQEWWTNAKKNPAAPNYSDSWILARRTATPNLAAQIVVFERAA
jgi:hypothetical protein